MIGAVHILLTNSIGLANVNKRLRLYYGDQFGLEIESTVEEGTKVYLGIPLNSD